MSLDLKTLALWLKLSSLVAAAAFLTLEEKVRSSIATHTLSAAAKCVSLVRRRPPYKARWPAVRTRPAPHVLAREAVSDRGARE